MRSEDRKKGIAEIVKGNNFSSDNKGKRLRYRGEVKTFVEYEIPMDLLVYNVENGRIASLVKSFQREHSSLDPEREADAFQIAKFLYDSNEISNKKTKDDIAKNGQLETGIITSDGVIVDGNRRASLMISILLDKDHYTSEQRARCEKFRAVVLPEDANDKDILRLETTYQLGSDEKVGYNAIEKYLHARDMLDKTFSINEIADFMGLASTAKVHELLEVVQLIDEYLDYCDCSGIYTRLPKGFEDDLLKLNQAIKKIRNGSISWIPTDKLEEVVNDLKCICFDYIRLNAKSNEGFDFRAIASTSNWNFLVNEEVWYQFVLSWKKATEEVDEESLDDVLDKSHNPSDTDRLLESRDVKWRKKVGEQLLDGFSDAKTTIDNKKEQEKPTVLLRRALSALDQIKIDKLDEYATDEQVITYIRRLCEISDIFLKL